MTIYSFLKGQLNNIKKKILISEKMNSNIEIPFEYTQEGDKCQMCYDPNIIEINSCQYCHPSEVETTRNDFCYPSEVETTRNDFLSLIKEIINNGKKYNDNDGLKIETSASGPSGQSNIIEVGPNQMQKRGKGKESGRLGKGKPKNPGKAKYPNVQIESEETSQIVNFQKYSILESDEIKVRKTTKRKTESYCQSIKKKRKISQSTETYYYSGVIYNDMNQILDEIKFQSGKIDQTKDDKEESHKKSFEDIDVIEKQEQVENPKETYFFACAFCSEKLDDDKALKEHVNSIHSDQFNEIPCEFCDYSAKNLDILKCHTYFHHNMLFVGQKFIPIK